MMSPLLLAWTDIFALGLLGLVCVATIQRDLVGKDLWLKAAFAFVTFFCFVLVIGRLHLMERMQPHDYWARVGLDVSMMLRSLIWFRQSEHDHALRMR